MSTSKLVKYTNLSPNRNSPRAHIIDGIAIHCYVGQVSIEDMGVWFSRSEAQASSNYGIGTDGRVGLYVPEADRAWTTSSRDVDNRCITIECACDKTAPNAVNDKVYATLIELCTDICKRNGIKQLIWSNSKDDRINHRNGCNMQVHRDYANKSCPGDFLYSRMGKIAAEVNARLNPSPASGIPTSKQDFINKVSAIAVELYKDTHILPSVVIGQACLESGYGLGADALILTKHNNILGMVADLINGTWQQYGVWNGETVTKPTQEFINGKWITKERPFRSYPNYKACLLDYEQFLLHVRNDLGYKYRSVQGMTDPKNVITVISRGGYATDPDYINKVMRVIKENNLTQYDKEKTVKWYRVAKDYKDGKYIGQDNAYESRENAVERAKNIGLNAYDSDGNLIYPEIDRYVVRRRFSEERYQIGAYHNLSNAKKQAKNNWGYRVYDLLNPNKAVYTPRLTRAQKLCAACVRINQWMVDDVKAGKDWHYDNVNKSEPTFWLTRKAKKYRTNCMGGVGFAMKEAGIPASSCDWYMSKGGITWLNKAAEKNLRKYADIIPVGDRTLKQIMDDGTLCPGDIVGFMTMNHTLIYIGNGLFFDSGHAYCKESGEGARFVSWIGNLSWPSQKVAYIIRMR